MAASLAHPCAAPHLLARLAPGGIHSLPKEGYLLRWIACYLLCRFPAWPLLSGYNNLLGPVSTPFSCSSPTPSESSEEQHRKGGITFVGLSSDEHTALSALESVCDTVGVRALRRRPGCYDVRLVPELRGDEASLPLTMTTSCGKRLSAGFTACLLIFFMFPYDLCFPFLVFFFWRLARTTTLPNTKVTITLSAAKWLLWFRPRTL